MIEGCVGDYSCRCNAIWPFKRSVQNMALPGKVQRVEAGGQGTIQPGGPRCNVSVQRVLWGLQDARDFTIEPAGSGAQHLLFLGSTTKGNDIKVSTESRQ